MLALASPALLVILLLIVLPVGWLAWQSIYHDGFTLENYRRSFSEDIYWRSFSLTFQISLLVTLLALLLGYPIAYVASAVPKGWSVLILALVILLLIVLPVGWLAWQSIYHDGFTLENYRRIFSEDIYWRSFSLTFE
ncbi:MAG TPA: hypothetical protein VK621_27100, partial [Bradyrhizobium sp.]|nr:hypothetical protein [Bradyrhizobium sp.]